MGGLEPEERVFAGGAERTGQEIDLEFLASEMERDRTRATTSKQHYEIFLSKAYELFRERVDEASVEFCRAYFGVTSTEGVTSLLGAGTPSFNGSARTVLQTTMVYSGKTQDYVGDMPGASVPRPGPEYLEALRPVLTEFAAHVKTNILWVTDQFGHNMEIREPQKGYKPPVAAAKP